MIWRKGWIHPILHIVLVQFILYFKSSLCKIARAARNWINYVPQAAVTTFAFSSVFILLLCAHHCQWPKVGSNETCASLCRAYKRGREAKIAICINNSAQQIGAQLKSTYLVFRDSGTGIFLISDSLTGRGGELSNLGFKYQLQAVCFLHGLLSIKIGLRFKMGPKELTLPLALIPMADLEPLKNHS